MTGLPVSGCWITTSDDDDEPATECFESIPDMSELPAVRVEGDVAPPRLTLSDGSSFSSAAVVEHDFRGDITTTNRLVSTDPCQPQQSADFEVDQGRRILYAYITFECGQGSAEYRFRMERPAD